MFHPSDVPPIAAHECVARFATQRGQFRADMTVKQDLFIPHKTYRETSVTRHRQATEEEMWEIGRGVAAAMGRTLYGRSDLQVADCTALDLEIVATPLLNNPNHADIRNWPEAKEDQKAIALKVAAVASMLKRPLE